MRILCIHGNGTNSNVLEMQTAPLRHELEESHKFDFVEGALVAPMTTRVQGIEVLTSPDSHFYAFYDPDDLSTLQESISLLDSYVTAEGPFDCILGFSAGAVLAALYMRNKLRLGEEIPLRCAIFVAGALSTNEEAYLGLSPLDDNQHADECASGGGAAARIPIPTAHIWGSRDETAPTGGPDISRMCDPATRIELVHDGGHEFPRSHYLTEAALMIQRTLQLGREWSA